MIIAEVEPTPTWIVARSGMKLARHGGANRADDPLFLFARGRRYRQSRGVRRALDEPVDRRDMHRIVAADPHQVRGDLGNHQLGALGEQLRHDLEVAEVDVAVRVGRRDRHQVDIEIVEARRQHTGAVVGERDELAAAARKDSPIHWRQVKRFQAEALAQPGQIPTEE